MNKGAIVALCKMVEARVDLIVELRQRIDEMFVFIPVASIYDLEGCNVWRMSKEEVYSAIGVCCNSTIMTKLTRPLLFERGVESQKLEGLDYFRGLRFKSDELGEQMREKAQRRAA